VDKSQRFDFKYELSLVRKAVELTPKMKNRKTTSIKNQPVKPVPVLAVPAHVPPLFRPVDWLALGITAVVVFIVFFLTLAPDVTLEDSGEMATASFYGGIPHAPGYPFWTLYTWLWTYIPFGSVAWRVELGNAFAGAIAAGLLAFVVSRSSSMIIESIDAFKNISRRSENAICFVSGFVAGGLSDFNSYLWSQAVIVDKHTLSIASLLGVVVFLLRWVYAPHQHRYLYAAFFTYGICFTNHQSLLPIIMGMQVLMWLAEPKLGREFFFGNTVIFLACEFFIKPGLLINNTTVFAIYNIIGITSAALWIWLVIKTKKTAIEFGRDAAMLALFGCLGLLFLGTTDYLPAFNSGQRLFLVFIATIVASGFFIHLVKRTKALSKEWLIVLVCGVFWLMGAAFYFYEPIACMTDPPMQWAYPRTVEGFIHALTRGQYEPIHPTSGTGITAFQIASSFFATYGLQLWRYLEGIVIQFNPFFLLLALVIFLVYRKLKRRERVWIIGMVAIYTCIGPFLVLLLNFAPDRQSIGIAAPLFAAGHVFISMFVGYGLTIIAAFMATQYEAMRKWLLLGSLCALDFALFTVASNCQTLIGNLDDEIASHYGFIKVACWILVVITILVLRKNGLQNDRLLSFGVPGLFVLCSFGLTIATILQDRLNLNGFPNFFHNLAQAFSPHQYGLPVYAALILLGMALIFVCSVWAFRRKVPLGIALAVFAAIPTYSALTHWSHSEQRGHWFGYWFGHDMFTPPFGIYPEMTRNTILFGGTDPGRFVPTYMIFCESFVPPSCKPMDPNFDRRDVYLITQNALADGTYLQYLRAQYFRSAQKDPLFFQELLRGPEERADNYHTNILARLAGIILDGPLERRGAIIEARWRKEGVYPPKEIYIPSPEDSQRCFAEYTKDVARRSQLNQLQPGEIVIPVTNENGQVSVQVAGQIAVMKINGLLCKVIFDHNPDNDFFVEESFPLDWMFPYETPFSVIMKINRHPLPSLPEDVFKKDHEFWSQYSGRLIGNWITYDTSIKQIADFAEKIYLHRDFGGFKGSRKFIRDDNAQKAFSKLRSSIAGIYAWRLGVLSGTPTPPEYLPKNESERQQLIKEADFALKQSFAFCPYSPEAAFRYINFLTQFNRLDDALLVAQTCLKFDPYNGPIANLVKELSGFKKQSGERTQVETELQRMENERRANPTNFQNVFALAALYLQLQQTNRVIELFDQTLAISNIHPDAVGAIAQFYAQMGNLPKLESALEKLAAIIPNQPEPWYDLAALNAVLGKTNESLQDLRTCLDLNAKHLQRDPKAHDLLAEARKDQRFAPLRNLPEFQKIVPTN
jgi:tetratricopeptide (TPR) repeat protein